MSVYPLVEGIYLNLDLTDLNEIWQKMFLMCTLPCQSGQSFYKNMLT